jgi:enterochelin esterase family protein
VTPQAPAAGALTPEASIQFGESLVADVVPFVEKHYRVTADRDHRAIAGLSMGGAQSIYTGLNHLDTFSYVASFSGAFVLWPGAMKRVPVAPGSTLRGPGVGQELQMDAVEKTLPGVAAGNNAKLHLLYLSCGMDDGLLTTNRQFMDWLTGKGVVYQKMLLPGYAHVWPFWRISLADLMPQLFTVEPGKGPAKKSKAGM